jgi:predicted amidohydrolase
MRFVQERIGMRVGLYQNLPRFGAVDQNVEEVVKALTPIQAELVVLPELFATGYQFVSRQEVETLAEEVPSGKTCKRMIELAKETGMTLVFGIAERNRSQIFNSAAVVNGRGFVGLYRKTHLFAEEKHWFAPGDTGFQVFDMGKARLGVMICFDWWFPESPRVLALMGADIICHPANLVLPQCQRIMPAHSLLNGVFAITANRVGTEARGGKAPLQFTGKSQIVDPRGKVLANLDGGDTGVLLTDIDPAQARDKAITGQNDRFMDRRPEYYGTLMDRNSGAH